MDLQKILREKIDALPDGFHMKGLRSVKLHIDNAAKHFERGHRESDQSLFTDAIYRCNQAFEGSIKEAYRVLAGKDPAHQKPYEIEQYLENNKVLKSRILDQFKNYRKEWRNPSTHDYMLDFNYDEALLAISAVAGFAIVLSDQISSRLAFNDAAALPAEPPTDVEKAKPLLELVSARLRLFGETHIDSFGVTKSASNDYYRLEGAVAGFLDSALSSIATVKVSQELTEFGRRIDLMVEKEGERIAIEIKRLGSSRPLKLVTRDATNNALDFAEIEGVTGAIAFVYSIKPIAQYRITLGPGHYAENVRIIAPVTDTAPESV